MRFQDRFYKVLSESNNLIGDFLFKCNNRTNAKHFKGTTKIAVEQDFYASIYLSNMIELARQESDKIIEAANKDKNLKHEYKTNHKRCL